MKTTALGHVLEHLRHLAKADAARDISDAELLERFQSQAEEAAFAILVHRHGPMVFNLCRRLLGNVHEAEDAFQATFLVLARKARQIRKPPSLGSWLYGVAYRIARRARIGAAQRRRQEQQVARTIGQPYAEPSCQELRAVLDEELQRLPIQYRAPVVLCYLEGKTHFQAGQELDWPKSSVTARLERARKILQRRLTRRGFGLGAGLLALGTSENMSSAAVPARLILASVRLAVQAAAGRAAATAPAVVLANGLLKGAALAKLAVLAALIAGAGLIVAGAGALARSQEGVQESPVVLEGRWQERPTATPNTPPRTDSYGDPLPAGALFRLGTTRFRHSGTSLTFLSDDKILVSGGRGKSAIRFWDVDTGKRLRQLELDAKGINSFAISPDGKFLAAAGSSGALHLWDIAAGQEIRTLEGQAPKTLCVAFSPNGRLIASGGFADHEVHLWDAATGTRVQRCQGHQDHIFAVAFAPDGKVLASAGADSTFRLWSTETGTELHKLPAPPNQMLHVAFTGDGRLATGGWQEKTIHLWNPATGKELQQIAQNEHGILSLAFSPDGITVATGSNSPQDGTIRLWDLATGRELRRITALPTGILGLAYSRDGKIIASSDGVIRLWDSTTGKELRPFPEHYGCIETIAVSPNGKVLATGSKDGTVRLWDAARGAPLREIVAHAGGVTSVAFSPDGATLASGGADGVVRLWDVTTARQLRTIEGQRYYNAVAFAPDGRTLATGGSQVGGPQKVKLWDVATGAEVRPLTEPTGDVYHLAFAPDGRSLAVVGADQRQGKVSLWDVATGKNLRTWSAPQMMVLSVAFAPDGKFLATGGFGTSMEFWDLATGKLRHQFPVPSTVAKTAVDSLAFTPDGKRFATGNFDQIVRLWEVATGQECAHFAGHEPASQNVMAVAFSPNGKVLYSAGGDTTALAWDVAGPGETGQARRLYLDEAKLRTLWQELAQTDAGKAYQAVCALSAAPADSAAFLRAQLKSPAPIASEKVTQWIGALDSPRFATRKQATQELERAGDLAESALRQALQSNPPAEQRQRIEELLKRLEPGNSPEPVRTLRAIEVLEHIGNSDAKRVLASLAKGPAEALLTREAKASLERLTKNAAP